MKGCETMVGLLSDVGNIRTLNEDYIGYFEDDNLRVYVIADGMGGHNAGEVASKLAVEVTIAYIKDNRDKNDIETILKEAILCSNDKIYALSKSDEGLSGMGTTISACLLKSGKMVVANVGDSSCYTVDENGITKVTKDHSLVQQLIDNGSITIEEAKEHPNRNIITRALGTSSIVDIDTFCINPSNILKVVLATDGLTNDVNQNEIYNIVINSSSHNACLELIKLSKLNGGRDNISVIIFEGECENDRNFARK